MRIIELITIASEHLGEKGFENSRIEVERMLGSVLGKSRLDLYMSFDRPLTEDERERFRIMFRRRLAHEPLQHVIGSTGFRELEIKTDRRALIPRSETELLVEIAVDFLKRCDNPRAADLGTGSGVIALSVAYEVEGSHVVAVDISDEALAVAEQNARLLGVEDRLVLVRGDMLDGLEGRGLFDAVLSNPPYVRSGDIDSLQPEVSKYEPRIALDGGPDGFTFLRLIARGAHHHLKPGGLLLMECGEGQTEEIQAEITTTGRYSESEIVSDLAGEKRIVRALSNPDYS